ncbi:MAG TPA: hypothetical protein VNN17_04250 [Terriglobia bacterium]|nr:hypothetical protein [Terriglobia bacterium]
MSGIPPLAAQRGQSAGPLKIADVLFEDYEGWKRPRLELPAGAEAVLYFRIEGFERREGRDEAGIPEYQVDLRWEVQMHDPQGTLVVPPQQGRLEQRLGPRDDQWQPAVRWSAVIPPWAPSGSYPVRIRVSDEIGRQQAEHTARLQIRGEAVPEASAFQAIRFGFARSPDGPWTATRYFALRDPVHVRFTVVGFQVSPDKRVWVEQDWAVVDAEGRVMVQQPNAIREQSQEFYPPRYLTTTFQVELQDPRPGSYKLQIALRDRIGEQAYALEAPFTLRP